MKRMLFLTLTTVCAWVAIPVLFNCAQEPKPADEAPKIYTESFDLTVYPKAEPVPALKYKFLPDTFERNSGNAASLYLKAMGFLEQTTAKKKLFEIEAEAEAKAQAEKVGTADLPPLSYLDTPPSKYPIEVVKEYLKHTAFQLPILEQAWLRDRFEMDRQIKDSKNPFAILIPEVQGIRDLARKQSMRCRLAIAESRIDDAIKIVGQQYAMARHLGQDDFLVSALVGCAIQGIATEDLYYLLQHPDCPNLFWAASRLPTPIIDWERCLSSEYHFIDLQFAKLQQVNVQLRSEAYWQEFITELAEEMKTNGVFYWSGNGMHEEPKSSSDPISEIQNHVSSSYAAAKEFLIQQSIVSPDKIDAYPKAQVFFLAMKHHFEQSRDELFKWYDVALHQGIQQIEAIEKKNSDRSRPEFTRLSEFLFSGHAVRYAQARSIQRMLLIQAVEGIRLYGAVHDGKLPESLADLPYPLPADPASGQPLIYVKKGDTATITTAPAGKVRAELNIRFAEPKK